MPILFRRKTNMAKKRVLWIMASVFISYLILSPVLAKADYLIKKNKHTDEVTIMGETQPAKVEQGMTWIAKDRMREDMGNDSVILRFDLNKLYVIDHAEKTYSEIDLPIDLDKVLAPEAKQMMQMIQVTVNVSDTGETKQIKGWNSKKYVVEVAASFMGMSMPIKMEMWVTKDLGIDMDLYKKFATEILALNPMFESVVKEFKKIDGIAVLTTFSMTMMGSESKYQEEVVSAEKMDAPAGTYDLPHGYTQSAYNPFDQKR